MAYDKERAIVAQNSASNAAHLLAVIPEIGELPVPNILALFRELQAGIFTSSWAIATSSTAAEADAAVAQVTAAFPGSAVEAAPAPTPPPAVTQPATAPEGFAPAPPPVTTPAAPSGDVEALWRDYFGDPSKWWDNRADKQNPNAPDFKKKVHKDASSDEKRNASALWINGKVPTPTWVKQALGVG